MRLPRSKIGPPAETSGFPTLNIQDHLLVESTLDECIQEFMRKPVSQRHLYEIHTTAQPPLIAAVLSAEIITELARLRDYLDLK